ncbi:U32 family peptidase [Geomicrobium sp. JCM 19038]|uniref:U32 family peptidase n=1 Tax=Geomicrobium sp. JCM 19038 TaxID=1460635 RepID=UPI00045F447C|nr:U32 family peptidase [Geomicrobium sp. JCM 19038]GAK07069.1 hypothetical protein JCM19038_788 [Geomicrobium sp. JCM 19038]
MKETRQFIQSLGFPDSDLNDLPTSKKRFPDGAQYRIEIPSVEGPEAVKAVLSAKEVHQVDIHRISQGSGIMLLTDDEIIEMRDLCNEQKIELSLFVGPRGTFDVTAMQRASAGQIAGLRSQGMNQLVYAIEDIKRACKLGIRSILVADEGLLSLVNEAKKGGQLPSDLVVKVSVQVAHANPVSIRIMETIGANTYNVPTDLTLDKLAAIREAVDIPIDMYVEAPDDVGGFIRYYDIPEIIRIAAPVYIKFGLRNAPNIYPSGTHLEDTVVRLTKERVRRAKLGLDIIQRYAPELNMSPAGSIDLGLTNVKV